MACTPSASPAGSPKLPTREPTQVADIAAPGANQSHIQETLLGAGYRALLAVPILREREWFAPVSSLDLAP